MIPSWLVGSCTRPTRCSPRSAPRTTAAPGWSGSAWGRSWSPRPGSSTAARWRRTGRRRPSSPAGTRRRPCGPTCCGATSATSSPRPGSQPPSTAACTSCAATTAPRSPPTWHDRSCSHRTGTAARRSTSPRRCPPRRRRTRSRSRWAGRPPGSTRRWTSTPGRRACTCRGGRSPASSVPAPAPARRSGSCGSAWCVPGCCWSRPTQPVEQVAASAGFGSSAALRQHFAREFRTSPRQHRAAFRTAP